MVTLRNKIGQMLLMGFDGASLRDDSALTQWLSDDGLGGVILFDKNLSSGQYGKNLQNSAQIKQLIQQIQDSSQHGMVLTAIDYEGGAVDRLASMKEFGTTRKPVELAALSASEFEKNVAHMAVTLQELGFNLNFAPVVDLGLNEKQGIIGALGRSFSADPVVVAELARQFVQIFARYGIACCYKHFPGHGSATGDTHEGFVDVTDSFHADELVPYSLLLQDKNTTVMVMTAHVVNNHLDSQGLPATLSHEILTGLLRNTMHYDGIIISDDLQMQAIASHYTLEQALCLTINAGADMVIVGNQLGSHSAPELINCIENLVLEGVISAKRIDEAYSRVQRLKQQLGQRSGIVNCAKELG